ncbi:TIGR03564 family F420-dependent LLM class oxidoreductase [Frankia sp. AgKG'84/4]|uniref:TIGR03564 family F420-dependent LLM class oxidoreductase n=1 Tax=Frankia sp. AgKG'84/4 TaxID=573490 RepID=UPI00200E25A0|nr:TIGR03564 family F420-dependent LLM class oxidoreductase [Frankia sp. AgKG'84/4]MCL9795156.1 TIGR03564 family F420-dependent LLM class oxidoreductase [Frankia sp. AgKG'84/4]
MKVGLYLGAVANPAAALEEIRAAARAGFASVYLSQLLSWDALTLVALGAASVPGIELGTAVVPTYPRHPLALAGQALTAQAVASERITVGIGPSHRAIIEGMFGYSYDRPVRHLREYLGALVPLLRGEAVEIRGQSVTAIGRVDAPVAITPSVLLSALGPAMLRAAAELADGTVTVWTGPRTVAEHIVPTITKAAAAAGRPDPRVVTAVGVCVTANPDRVRTAVAEQVGFAADFPAYRAVLDREGLRGVEETIVAGDEADVERALRRYADAGSTELLVSVLGDPAQRARTIDVVSGLRARL